MLNPDSLRGFVLTAGGFASHRGFAAQRAAIDEIFAGAAKITPERAEQAEAEGGLADFNKVVTELELRLGREAMSADDRTSLEKDPVARAAWVAKVEQVTSRTRAREVAAADTSKTEAEAAAIRERGRLASLGLFAALAAEANRS